MSKIKGFSESSSYTLYLMVRWRRGGGVGQLYYSALFSVRNRAYKACVTIRPVYLPSPLPFQTAIMTVFYTSMVRDGHQAPAHQNAGVMMVKSAVRWLSVQNSAVGIQSRNAGSAAPSARQRKVRYPLTTLYGDLRSCPNVSVGGRSLSSDVREKISKKTLNCCCFGEWRNYSKIDT